MSFLKKLFAPRTSAKVADAPESNIFRYGSLATGQIRLLELRRDTKEFCYQMKTVELESAPKYTALSYTWGDPAISDEIEFDGKQFGVRSNLKDALSAIHKRHAQRQMCSDDILMLWIDAICINQGDDPEALNERSKQVGMMKSIYEAAEEVFVWLGRPKSENSAKLAFIKLWILGDVYKEVERKAWTVEANMGPSPFEYNFVVATKDPEVELLLTKSEDDQAWEGLLDMWQSPWWDRTWIVQEGTVPGLLVNDGHNPTFQYPVKFAFGHETVDWTSIVALHMFCRHRDDVPASQVYLEFRHHSIEMLAFFRELRNLPDKSRTLLEVLESSRYAQCSDPRDKVYAPQALCISTPSPIEIDYSSKSYLDVCKDVVKYCLTQKGNELCFLGHAGMDPPATLEEGAEDTPTGTIIPGWIPDWSKEAPTNPIPKRLFVGEIREASLPSYLLPAIRGADEPSNAERVWPDSRTFKASGDHECVFLMHGDSLLVKGVRVGAIKEVSQWTIGENLEISQQMVPWIMAMTSNGLSLVQIKTTLASLRDMDLLYSQFDRPDSRINRTTSWDLPNELGTDDLKKRLAARGSANWKGRQVCQLEQGLLGVVPLAAKPGDEVFVFAGGQVPYVIRPMEGSELQYFYVGESYIHAAMDGVVVAEGRQFTWQSIVLV